MEQVEETLARRRNGDKTFTVQSQDDLMNVFRNTHRGDDVGAARHRVGVARRRRHRHHEHHVRERPRKDSRDRRASCAWRDYAPTFFFSSSSRVRPCRGQRRRRPLAAVLESSPSSSGWRPRFRCASRHGLRCLRSGRLWRGRSLRRRSEQDAPQSSISRSASLRVVLRTRR